MKKVLAIFLTLSIMLCNANVVYALGVENDIDIFGDNEIYYEDIQMNEINSCSLLENGQLTQHLNGISQRNGGTLVSTIQRKVGVIETIDENGDIVESHLMTKKEYKQINPSGETRSIESVIEEIDTDSETHSGGCLTIELGVYLMDNSYFCVGAARWIYKPLRISRDKASVGYDFIALTWGGAGELKCIDYECAGKYSNNADIPVNRKTSDIYGGYCWQFNEQLDLGANMKPHAEQILASVELQKTYSSYKSKETNVQLTYIHTYQEITGSVSFTVDTTGQLAAGISLSGCEKQWTMEIDIGGVMY